MGSRKGVTSFNNFILFLQDKIIAPVKLVSNLIKLMSDYLKYF